MSIELRNTHRVILIRVALAVPFVLVAAVIVLNWPIRWFRISNQTRRHLALKARAFDAAPWTDLCELNAGEDCVRITEAVTGEGNLSVEVEGRVLNCRAYASRSPLDLLAYPYEVRVEESNEEIVCRATLLMPFPAMTPIE